MVGTFAPAYDVVHVWVSASGSPERFVAAGRRYRVVSKPAMWLDRAPWWSVQRPGRAAPTAADLEREIWRVRAALLDDGSEIDVDLERDSATGRWSVAEPSE